MAAKNTLKIVVSRHARERITERFRARDPTQIVRIIKEAVSQGFCSAEGDDVVIEHGCLLIAGILNNGVLTITTVLNLSDRISKRFQRRLANSIQSNWNAAITVISAEDGAISGLAETEDGRNV